MLIPVWFNAASIAAALLAIGIWTAAAAIVAGMASVLQALSLMTN